LEPALWYEARRQPNRRFKPLRSEQSLHRRKTPMPVWITAKLPFKQWGAVQFRVEMMQQDMKSALHVAMLRRPGPAYQDYDIYIVLPDTISTLKFPEFHQIPEEDLPTGLIMMVGNEESFRKRFPSILPEFN
jgi:hypothetical protein